VCKNIVCDVSLTKDDFKYLNTLNLLWNWPQCNQSFSYNDKAIKYSSFNRVFHSPNLRPFRSWSGCWHQLMTELLDREDLDEIRTDNHQPRNYWSCFFGQRNEEKIRICIKYENVTFFSPVLNQYEKSLQKNFSQNNTCMHICNIHPLMFFVYWNTLS